MKKYFIYILVFLAVTSCSNEKNTFISRAFHRTTTHYNGFFNAREELRIADKNLWEDNEEDWENILPMFIYGGESVYGNMETAIEKCSRAIDKHSIYIKKQEHNSWIDDTYLLMGKAFLYKKNYPKAEEIFKYVEKQYRKEPIVFDARLWQAVLFTEEKNYIKAATILEKLEEERKDFPKHFEGRFREVYADFYLKQEQYDFAVDELQNAIVLQKNKKRKTRLTFILAQIYDTMGKSTKSINHFAKVLKLRPDYEMEFYAKINQALAFDARADGTGVREVLSKLLKEKKYEEFKDQIYFALAQVEFADRNDELGIAHLVKSTEVSINNDRQKGKSFLSLSKIYFEQRDYRIASSYYDSTITYLPSDFPDYTEIKDTKENLSDLVGHINIVEYQDSLLTLGQMEEKELNKVLRKVIKDKQEQLAEKRRLEAEQRENELANRIEGIDNRRNGQVNGGGRGGSWYFYNTTAKSSGFAEFRRKYGNRKWEDNWKRKDKSQTLSEDEELAEGEDGKAAEDEDKIPTIDELKERLPLSEEDQAASNKKISDSMYEIGRIYKEKFDDQDNAIESFEEMSIRYPEAELISTVYYELYILYLKKEETGRYQPPDYRSTSKYYKDLITEDFSQTEFSAILNDPDFQSDKNKRAEEVLENYKNTYRQFRRKNYNEVLVTCIDVIKNDQSNKLLAKYHMLKALVIAQKKDRENYVKALQEIVMKFPSTEEGDEAARLLGLLGETAQVKPEKKENLLEGLEAAEVKKEEKEEPARPKAVYSKKLTGSHYFAMVVPNKEFDTNELKYKFSDYNKESFASEGLKVTSSFITKDLKLILVRTFKEKDTSMNYYESAKANDDILKEINAKGFKSFVITSKNFAQLFKSKDVDDYMKFFNENYLN